MNQKSCKHLLPGLHPGKAMDWELQKKQERTSSLESGQAERPLTSRPFLAARPLPPCPLTARTPLLQLIRLVAGEAGAHKGVMQSLAPGTRGLSWPAPACLPCELLNLQDVLSQERMEPSTLSTEENDPLLHSCPQAAGNASRPARAESSIF